MILNLRVFFAWNLHENSGVLFGHAEIQMANL